MDQFLSTYEEAKKEELSRLETLENNNVALLEKLSRHLAHFKQLPRFCLFFLSGCYCLYTHFLHFLRVGKRVIVVVVAGGDDAGDKNMLIFL